MRRILRTTPGSRSRATHTAVARLGRDGSRSPGHRYRADPNGAPYVRLVVGSLLLVLGYALPVLLAAGRSVGPSGLLLALAPAPVGMVLICRLSRRAAVPLGIGLMLLPVLLVYLAFQSLHGSDPIRLTGLPHVLFVVMVLPGLAILSRTCVSWLDDRLAG